MTADALRCLMVQEFIVGLDRRRDLRLHGRQIIKFVDHGNVQICDTRLAVSAVGALPAVGVKRRVRKHGRIVFLFLRSRLVSYPHMMEQTPGLVSA